MDAPPRLTVITITCRTNPRLTEMGRTLRASFLRAERDARLQWVIVDELDRDMAPMMLELGGKALFDDDHGDATCALLAPGFTIERARPWHTEHRTRPDRTPAHNSARNAGLERATGDFVVFLNDCSVVTSGWVQVAIDCARARVGWRCKADSMHEMKIPENGVVRHRDHHDLLRKVPPSTVVGPCWGAPIEAFASIRGFDLAYDGHDKCHDLDAITRLARVGVQFVTTERALVVRLRRTKSSDEISTRADAFVGAPNKLLYNELLRDSKRTSPLRDGFEAPSETVPAFARAAVAPEPGEVSLSDYDGVELPIPVPEQILRDLRDGARSPERAYLDAVLDGRRPGAAISVVPARNGVRLLRVPGSQPGAEVTDLDVDNALAGQPIASDELDLSDVDDIDDVPPDELDHMMGDVTLDDGPKAKAKRQETPG